MKNKHIIATLINSCVEGYTEEWDCSSIEGKEGFKDMITMLEKLAKNLNIEFSPSDQLKSIPD